MIKRIGLIVIATLIICTFITSCTSSNRTSEANKQRKYIRQPNQLLKLAALPHLGHHKSLPNLINGFRTITFGVITG